MMCYLDLEQGTLLFPCVDFFFLFAGLGVEPGFVHAREGLHPDPHPSPAES